MKLVHRGEVAEQCIALEASLAAVTPPAGKVVVRGLDGRCPEGFSGSASTILGRPVADAYGTLERVE